MRAKEAGPGDKNPRVVGRNLYFMVMAVGVMFVLMGLAVVMLVNVLEIKGVDESVRAQGA